MPWLLILRSRWLHYGLLALACGLLWIRGNHHESRADNCEIARANDRKAYELAAREAEQDQIAVNQEPARKSAEIARKSDVNAQAYYEKGRRAGLAYAAAHAVRMQDDAGRPAGDASVPGTDSPAQEHDGQGSPAGMVALSRQDFDILTGNSLRLAQVQQDAQALIDAGVAVSEIEVGFGRP